MFHVNPLPSAQRIHMKYHVWFISKNSEKNIQDFRLLQPWLAP